MDPFTPCGNKVAMISPMRRPTAAPSTKTGKKTPEGMGRETAMAVKKNCERERERENEDNDGLPTQRMVVSIAH